jgi:prevent-host-death family protein
MTTTVTADEAEAQIRDLLARVERGEEVVIERNGRPIARLAPSPGSVPGRRKLGWARGLVWVSDDFDAPMTDEEIALFENAPLDTDSAGSDT